MQDTGTAKNPLLSGKYLFKAFGKGPDRVEAVKNVSLDVSRGRTLGIVGESGSGKSTLARCLLRLIQPDSGSLIYNGVNITKISQTEMRGLRRVIQMIFQNPSASLNPKMSIGEAVMEPLKIWGIGTGSVKKQKMREMLDLVGISPDYSAACPHEFSGGQQQRINIARALILSPKVLICDEAVSALDVSVQCQIINLLMELQQELNLTMVFISHNLGVVEYVSDEVLILKDGRVVEQGPVEKVFQTPENIYTRKLLEAVPVMPVAGN